MVFLTTGFARVFPEKRVELKSLKGRMKAESEVSDHSRKTAEPRVHRGGADPLLKVRPDKIYAYTF